MPEEDCVVQVASSWEIAKESSSLSKFVENAAKFLSCFTYPEYLHKVASGTSLISTNWQ